MTAPAMQSPAWTAAARALDAGKLPEKRTQSGRKP